MSNKQVIEVTENNFDSLIASDVTLVDFWAPWCAPCLMQGQIIESVAEKFAGQANVGKMNVDSSPSIASRFGIRSIPTLILFKNGKAIDHFVGVQSEHTLVDALERNMSGGIKDTFVNI